MASDPVAAIGIVGGQVIFKNGGVHPTSECTSDYVREYISEYVSEYTSEYISEYISEYTSA